MNYTDILIIVVLTVLVTRLFSWLAARAHLRKAYASPIDPSLREVHRLGAAAVGRALVSGTDFKGSSLVLCMSMNDAGEPLHIWVASVQPTCEHGRALDWLGRDVAAGNCNHPVVDAVEVDAATPREA